jgi:TPR repeat protein
VAKPGGVKNFGGLAVSKGRDGAALFDEANERLDAGDFRRAFVLFKAAVRKGYPSALNNLGYAYDLGLGTPKNEKRAMFWYKKAVRRGDICAYTNIGTIYRDHQKFALARTWFLKAYKRGDGDAALEIGKLYLRNRRGLRQAERYLRLALGHKYATVASKEEAAHLLQDLKARQH